MGWRRTLTHSFAASKRPSVMIEKFAGVRRVVLSEFLDLNHTSKLMILVSLVIPKFARDPGCEGRRTSESGHSLRHDQGFFPNIAVNQILARNSKYLNIALLLPLCCHHRALLCH
jgi:hypothetical protein